MSRYLYTLIWVLILPLVLLRLLWRGRKQSAYRHNMGERFGRYPIKIQQPVLWVHAVSVGETRAAAPLVRALQNQYPDHRILMTCMTPTGRETAQQVYGDSADVVYLPYDLPWAIRGFWRHFKPQLGVFMETELWPNLLHACRAEQIPTLLANARLSARSAKGYGRIKWLIQPAIASLSAIAAQSEADAERLRQLGGGNITVCGNLKFDITPPDAMLDLGEQFRAHFGPKRRVILTASTREGEEALLINSRPQPWPQDWLWIIVPRHPQRFDEVSDLLQSAGLTVQRRSDNLPVSSSTQVWLGDSMGEMFAYYHACHLAFIGGSLLPFGSQNLIEAAAVGRPILIGPHTFNFAEASRLALEIGAAESIDSAAGFWARVAALLGDEQELAQRGEAGLRFSQEHRGATERVMAVTKALLISAK